MKHGGEPWEDMCVKLMLKWPNLYYMTSAFTPKWYPKAIVRYMNTRGKDKVMFAGYWPLIAYERVFAQFNDLQLRDDVWEKFLHRNAAKVFGLSDGVGRDANGDDDR
jgi:predicted TIM-barrel fold metal-dependent hydrolase